ncbi:MAG: ribonuclease HII [Candidatus Buchananbacteria bacterium RBG_13_36_9]|uniref:Ribonuclease HII n=1 Tax=Candidatus Buchananbacteria bacterium RBG_13_36_9 TaxID=1797530 RepID=A0A1G1XQL5_9BACT|nr:MAG: ribonuclease HII [Candidatus Buchananbacteria bacterium RBG_13_36_9]
MRHPNWQREKCLWQRGYDLVAGIDEVGRGSWAGPIVAAGVIFEKRLMIKGLKDSKKLSAPKREKLAEIIKTKALAWTVEIVDNEIIDEIGVGKANALVIDQVINSLKPKPQYLLIDKASVLRYKIRIPWETIIKGDNLVYSIAAASILAKVARDDIMLKLAKKYPNYGFDLHKGYGTELHQQMIDEHDICPLHRKSYKPINQLKLLRF